MSPRRNFVNEDIARKKLIAFIATQKKFQGVHVSLIKIGHNRNVYLLKKDGSKFVARVEHHKKDTGSSVASEVGVLRFLETKNITFAPKILAVNRSQTISIETHVGKQVGSINTLSDAQIDSLARQLVAIHNCTAKEVRAFYRKIGHAPPQIVTPIREVNLFGVKRLVIAKKLCPDKRMLRRIESRLKKNVRLSKRLSSKMRLRSAHLVWGDIGDNFCVGRNPSGVNFIDWEFARLACPTSELAYIKIHSHPSSSVFNRLFASYAKFARKSREELRKEIWDAEELTRVNDVIWATMKWGQHVGTQDELRYKKLAFERLKLLK